MTAYPRIGNADLLRGVFAGYVRAEFQKREGGGFGDKGQVVATTWFSLHCR